jgi:hypothetical protein
MLCGELLNSLLHVQLPSTLHCTWNVWSSRHELLNVNRVSSRLFCYPADENINKQMICHGTKANVVDLEVRILGHLDISVGAFHILYSFNVWPFKSYFSAVTIALCNWSAHRSTDFLFGRKDLCLMEHFVLFVCWRLNDEQKDLLFVQVMVL